MVKKSVLLGVCLVFVLSMVYADEATIQRLRAQGQKEGWTFTVGQTPVSDIPLEQLCGLVIPANWRQNGVFEEDIYGKQVRATPPASYDLRSLGYMTSVKNQGSCGSCWAFAHIGSYESAILWLGGPSEDLSEQFLVRCNSYGYGCNGGWLDAWPTFNNGVPKESCYPYTATDGSCSYSCTLYYPLVSWAYVGSSSGVPATSSIKQAIYDHGAVAVAVYANTAFQNYTSGIFNSCTNSSPNHAVVLAGWNDSSSYWILKNSWGTGWGQSGYMYITYGCSNVGYAAAYGIPEVGGTPPPTGDLADAIDTTYTVSTSGSANWTEVTDVYYYDGDSAKSGVITHSQSTTMTTTIAPTVASDVKFYWKVSSEASYDYLKFYIDGVLKGQIAGTVNWAQTTYAVTAGSHTLTWTYAKDSSVSTGSDCGWVDKLEVVEGSTPPPTGDIAEALDITGQTFTLSGSGNWYRETTTYYYGGDAAQSPVITHSQSASFETTITGKSSIKFYWRVSSESGYDYLSFYANGVRQARISGSTSWALKSYTCSPTSTYVLKWTYSKDASVSSGSDCGWVDYLRL